MPKVLIHIGYHKTGTKWLQKHLFSRDDVGFVIAFHQTQISDTLISPHSLDFEPNVVKNDMQRAIQNLQNQGGTPVISHERLSGNPHSGGYDSKSLADRLAAVFPEAKVLIVIREQKSMILSTYKQYVQAGGPSSLRNYLQSPVHGRNRIPLFEWDHFKYHRLITYYRHLFGHSNTLVLPYEMFRDTPVEFISRIIHFCELPPQTRIVRVLPYSTKTHKSLSAASINLKRRLNFVIGLRDRLNPQVLFPVTPNTNRKIKQYVRKLDATLPKSFKIAYEDRLKKTISSLIGDKYKRSNALTSKLLDVDVASYGYDMKEF